MRGPGVVSLEAEHRGVHIRGLITLRKKLNCFHQHGPEISVADCGRRTLLGWFLVRLRTKGLLAQFQKHTDLLLSMEDGHAKDLACFQLRGAHWLIVVFNLLTRHCSARRDVHEV
jgi:hypothetical protein